jgi:hypothetical protein
LTLQRAACATFQPVPAGASAATVGGRTRVALQDVAVQKLLRSVPLYTEVPSRLCAPSLCRAWVSLRAPRVHSARCSHGVCVGSSHVQQAVDGADGLWMQRAG